MKVKKRGKSKSSNLSRLKRLLTPNTPKKGMLLFVAVFVVVGGGYMLAKSFAYTRWKWVYPYTNVYCTSNCKNIDDKTVNSKNPPPVIRLNQCDTTTNFYCSKAKAKIKRSSSVAYNGNFCLYARSTAKGNGAVVDIAVYLDSVTHDNLIATGEFRVAASRSYSPYYCSHDGRISNGARTLIVTIGNQSRDWDVYIAKVGLQY